MTTQSRFMFFTTLLLITQTLPLHAIRTQKPILSFSLHPPKLIINPGTNSTETSLSRVAADAARVKYLNSRLENALFKSNSSFETEAFQLPVTFLSGAYIARLGVGTPATELDLVVDTGSSILWVKCAPCTHCFDPFFDWTRSNTYQVQNCNEPKCRLDTPGIGCSDHNTCQFQVTYEDGSQTGGDFVTETLWFSNTEYVQTMAIGCAHAVAGSVQSFSGIIGLGPQVVSLTNQLRASSFSYCMAVTPSHTSTLDFYSVAPRDSVTVTMVRNRVYDLYYYVELSGIIIENDLVAIPSSLYEIRSDGTGGVIVDSGTTMTVLVSEVYELFTDTFRSNAHGHLVAVEAPQGYDVCYINPFDGRQHVPAVSFQFSDGQRLALEYHNYFVQANPDGIFCLGFKGTGDDKVSIIGNIAQQNMRVTYDLRNNKIGFTPDIC